MIILARRYLIFIPFVNRTKRELEVFSRYSKIFMFLNMLQRQSFFELKWRLKVKKNIYRYIYYLTCKYTHRGRSHPNHICSSEKGRFFLSTRLTCLLPFKAKSGWKNVVSLFVGGEKNTSWEWIIRRVHKRLIFLRNNTHSFSTLMTD